MTNSEIWLDETLSNLKGIKSDLWMLHEIMSMPNCNDCKRKDCSYKPKWGEHIRYNCPLHLAEADRKTENSSEKPNNSTSSKMEQVETMSCQECKHWKYVSNYGWDCEFESVEDCKYEPKDEPQTDCAWK